MKLQDFCSDNYQYTVKKNILSGSFQTNFLAKSTTQTEENLKTKASLLVNYIELLLSKPLLNIKGRSQDEKLFLLSGTRKKAQQDDLNDLEYSLLLTTKFAGKNGKKTYMHQIIANAKGSIGNAEDITSVFANSESIEQCELHLEFLTETFFSRLGQVPIIEESIDLQIDFFKKEISLNAQSNRAINPELSPINNREWWDRSVKVFC